VRSTGEPVLVTATRVVSGAVFVLFGIGKFVAYDSELASFRHYGLPFPEVMVIIVGVVELAGGVLLVTGRHVRPAALVLAGNMLGAILVAGLGQGEVFPSLTLAPALLVAMVVVVHAEHPGTAPDVTKRPP
jgi:putative oxidoreductase